MLEGNLQSDGKHVSMGGTGAPVVKTASELNIPSPASNLSWLRLLKGKCVALDGTTGEGKSTLAVALRDTVVRHGVSAAVVPEFSNGPTGDLIRDIIAQRRFFSLDVLQRSGLADTLVLIADHLTRMNEAKGRVGEDAVLIADRGVLSLVAYQAVRIARQDRLSVEQVGEALVTVLHRFGQRLHLPAIHIILQISPEERAKRILSREGRALSSSECDFIAEVEQANRYFSRHFRTITVDVGGADPTRALHLVTECLEVNCSAPREARQS